MNLLAPICRGRRGFLRLLQSNSCHSRRFSSKQRLLQDIPRADAARALGTSPHNPTASVAPSIKPDSTVSDITRLAEFRGRFRINYAPRARTFRAGTADYCYLRDKGLLTLEDVQLVTRELVIAALIRQKASLASDDLIDAAHTVIRDIQAGLLPSHYLVSGYLIGVLRVSGTLEDLARYWNWLVDNGGQSCSVQTFGIMIEALAYRGAKLSIMEGMYKEAVKRFYQPNCPPTSRMLIQGILAARLLNGNWRGAYELYDHYLRLHPQSGSRKYIEELLMFERPPNEAAIIAIIHCRVGMPLVSGLMRIILHGIWINYRDVRSMLTIATAYTGVKGEVNGSLILRLLVSIMSSACDGPLTTPGKRYQEGYKFIYEQMHRITSVAASRGLLFASAKWTSLIYVAGNLKRRDMLEAILRVMRDIKVEFTSHHLIAAGHSYSMIGDLNMVVKTWKTLKEKFPLAADPKYLVRSLTACGLRRQVIMKLRDSKMSSADILKAADNAFSNPTPKTDTPPHVIRFTCPLIDNSKISLEKMREDIQKASANFLMALQNYGQPYEFSADPNFSTIPSKLPAGSSPPPVPREELESYYSTLASLGNARLGAVDESTGYTAEHLHFENWRSINQLLATAEENEEREKTARRNVRVLDFSTNSLLLHVSGEDEEHQWHRVRELNNRYHLEAQAKERIRERKKKEAEQDENDEADEEPVDVMHRRKMLHSRANLWKQLGMENLVRDLGKIPFIGDGETGEEDERF
ncbi:hypothetical protein L873DRAFT_51723 [Choiromyces venosus 120613-1]|uniref:Uncharacterized protein n=1 Tax=Choiromyces venosus 120613-1 TaxID=1336337 RepID=A0A3N4JI26_9PEZI|nr:hypothetical protein L873DRAFT_51723 [Choiromyces venosus 120613-1]